MNQIKFLLFFLFIVGCKTNQNTIQKIPVEVQNISCPENGDCTFEVLKNSTLIIKTDNLGKIYPQVAKGNKLVIKYHFKRHQNEKVTDSNYEEFVYFEIDKNEKQLMLKDRNLQNVKLLFGRICFCRGAMGYFKVNQGTLYLVNKNKNLQFNLEFEVSKVPQLTNKLNESIKY